MLRCTRLLPRQRIARHVRYITSEELSERERLRADMQRLGLSDPVEVEIKYADPCTFVTRLYQFYRWFLRYFLFHLP